MFAEKMKAEGKKSFHAALIKSEPVLKENYIIEMKVDNKVQEENLIKEKPILLDYLKAQLNNYSLQVNAIVTEQKTEVHLYTDKEKFKEMLKINPDLMYLKEKFNLDFEF
jgi:DNA polymerase-3 subunit gamma/tau